MSDLKQRLYERFKMPSLAVLATITDEGKPWARYVTPWADENLTFWLGTFMQSRKIEQIGKNPEVHLTLGATGIDNMDPWLHVQGRAEILTDAASRKAIWNDRFKVIFSGPDDPNFAVCKITPYRIEYQTFMKPPEIWEA